MLELFLSRDGSMLGRVLVLWLEAQESLMISEKRSLMRFMKSLYFDIPVTDKCDSYGRYRLYMEEMKESVRF